MTSKLHPDRRRTGRVVGYIRVSTADQKLGPEAQRERLVAETSRRGWRLDLIEDNGSGATMKGRPGLAYALDLLARGRADALVVTRLDRLARSVGDFAAMLQQSRAEGWDVIVLDHSIDTGTANGRLVAGILMELAQWESEIIAERTREALAAKRARGERLGRISTLAPAVVGRIAAERAGGASFKVIADRLNAEQIPTSQRGRWHPATVRYVLGRAEAAA